MNGKDNDMKIHRHTAITILFLSISILLVFPSNSTAQKIIVEEEGDTVKLWLEAEAGKITSPMNVFDDNDASGGQFIEVVSGNNNTTNAPADGHISYQFTIESAGKYKVWGRVIAAMDEEDAFWVRMDDEEWIKWKDISVGCKWHWDEVHDNENKNSVIEFDLAEGHHTLMFTYLLDQTRLDKLLITNDLNYLPQKSGPGAKAVFEMSSSTPAIHETVHFDGSGSASSEGAIVTYEWDFGDGSAAGGKTVTHAYGNTGEYPVKLIVIDKRGFSSIVTRELTAYTDVPVARFSYSPDRAEVNELLHFDGASSFDPNGEIVSYEWEFGDGATGNGVEVTHSYASAGEYYATLNVTDQHGKTARITRLVTIITGVPKKIIYETDMCLDVDDVGALAVLHAMANKNEVELLAVCYNEVHPHGASAIDAVNTWYGRGDIPVGVYKGSLPDPDYSPYLEPLSLFPNDLDNASAPGALEVYQKVLSGQPDGSVTIISVGFLNNLGELLREYPGREQPGLTWSGCRRRVRSEPEAPGSRA